MNNRRQDGFVLISALIFLVLMMYLGVAMFRGFGLDQMMASNLREKSRATEAAQAAIDFAEWWLIQPGNATTGVACTAAGAQTGTQVCTGTPSLTSFANFTDTTALPVSTSGGVGNYYANPIYSIYYLGLDTAGKQMYSITAQGWGGNKNAVATLQTVFRVGCKICDLGSE
ncbi:pilus assembly PilX family protein [Paraherbaspirillum soli]|uniref:PilX N-terminal domain-containing pilus assembly protein n=1 Tax=Paraherbaspirillum soli TaxID=631222 RepID=A0ABW0M5U5_9BURK